MIVIALVAAVLLLATYLVAGGIVVTNMVRPARMPLAETPSESGVGAVEPVSLQTEDNVTLQGYMLSSPGDRAILLIHGVYSHSWDGQNPDIARALLDAGFDVLLVDLRAQGRSGGDHLGLGWLERYDIAAAVGFLLSRGFEPGEIGIHATSYGASTCLLAAATIPAVSSSVSAFVLDTPFADASEVVEGEIRRPTGLPAFLTSALARHQVHGSPDVRAGARRHVSRGCHGGSFPANDPIDE